QGLEQSKKNSIIGVSFCFQCSLWSSLRGAKRRSNPDYLSGDILDCFAEPVIGPRFARTRWLAMTTVRPSFLLHQLLRALSEHVLARLLVERLLHELADRKPRLQLRPRANLGVPAFHV